APRGDREREPERGRGFARAFGELERGVAGRTADGEREGERAVAQPLGVVAQRTRRDALRRRRMIADAHTSRCRERRRRRLAELIPIVAREAAELAKAVGERDARHGRPGLRVEKLATQAREAHAAGEYQRRRPQVAPELRLERARAHARRDGER